MWKWRFLSPGSHGLPGLVSAPAEKQFESDMEKRTVKPERKRMKWILLWEKKKNSEDWISWIQMCFLTYSNRCKFSKVCVHWTSKYKHSSTKVVCCLPRDVKCILNAAASSSEHIRYDPISELLPSDAPYARRHCVKSSNKRTCVNTQLWDSTRRTNISSEVVVSSSGATLTCPFTAAWIETRQTIKRPENPVW